MIHIGTSGFSYDDWVGPVYPAGLSQARLAVLLCPRLHAPCELNFTYYRPRRTPRKPSRPMVRQERRAGGSSWSRRRPRLTHQRAGDEGAARARAPAAALAPLTAAGVLGGVLLQFPFSFHATPENADYLARLRALLPAVPLVVELRNARWVSESTFDRLRTHGLAFCNVDEPRLHGLLPPLGVVTAEPGYVRFHGRNAAKWWRHEQAHERYDYLYNEEELKGWVPKVTDLKRA